MYHNISIPQNIPQKEPLEKVIELILSFVMADSIYFSPHLEEELNEGIIIVIIGKNSPHDWDDITDYCWKIFESYPQFSFRIFDSSWVKEELAAGNSFFAMHCSSRELVYSVADSNANFYIEKLKPKRFLKKSKCRYQIDNQTSFAAGLNVRHYKSGKNYLQAVYSLHQSIKFLYISASWFLTGEWLAGQDLEIHQKHIGRFSKSLGKVFDLDNSEEVALMEQLNGSCSEVQYNQKIPEITLQIIEAGEVKWNYMKLEVQRLFDACISRCKKQFSTERIPLIGINKSDPLELITTIITDTIETMAIYYFGKRSINQSLTNTILDESQVNFENSHYYLFVIVNQYTPDAAANLADRIKRQTGGQHTATILLHKKTSLKQKRGDQQFFFLNIMQSAPLIFRKEENIPYMIVEETPARNLNSTIHYASSRKRNVSTIWGWVYNDCDLDSSVEVKASGLHQVMEQMCLALIRVFLGYTPNYFSLDHLFNLCAYFTTITTDFFPLKTPEDQSLFKILKQQPSILRFSRADDVEDLDYQLLEIKCTNFIKQAEILIQKELDRLKEIESEQDKNEKK